MNEYYTATTGGGSPRTKSARKSLRKTGKTAGGLERFMQPRGVAVKYLAQKFLGSRPGERVAPVSRLAEDMDTSTGTVQQALKDLEGHGAVGLRSRGHMGSYITEVSYEKLALFTGSAAMVFALPLPYTRRLEGLSTALFQQFRKQDLAFAFELAYMRGARQRCAAVIRGRYEAALVSRLAAESLIKEGEPLTVAASFGKGSYLSSHGLIYRKKTVKKIRALGVDSGSLDQVKLTASYMEEHGGDIEIVEIPYNQIVSRIFKKNVDGAVWNRDYLLEHDLKLNYQPLAEGDSTEAVVVTLKENRAVENTIRSALNIRKFLKIQKKVVDGTICPEY